MGINLAEKYSKKIVDKFYVDSVVTGHTNQDYEWDGVKSINVWTIATQATNAYDRTASSNRYGTPSEVEDTLQTMEITQDRSVSLVVDKGNNTEQMLIKNAGVVVAREMREQFIPEFDKYCLDKWNDERGAYTVDSSLTTDNIVAAIGAHAISLGNAGTTVDDACTYIGWTNYGLLVGSKEFINLEALGTKAVEKGVVGMARGLQIKPVPDSYLPEGVNFLTVKKSCVLAPTKIKDIKIHEDAPGYSGALMEIRWMYDAFVLETKNAGVIASLTDTPSL